jgi:O-methyltransferase involved in polyketide biosynthesis
VLRGEGRYEDERKIVESVAKAGEKWQFGIEEGQLEPLLANYGFRLFDEANATKLEQVYFTDTNRRVVGNVNRTHCLVRATKVK